MLHKNNLGVKIIIYLDYELKMEKNGVYSGSLFLDVDYYEHEEIVGAYWSSKL